MPISQQAATQYLNTLKQAIQQLMISGKFTQAAALAGFAGKWQAWLNQGMQGDTPVAPSGGAANSCSCSHGSTGNHRACR